MSIKAVIIGLGEVGKPLAEILSGVLNTYSYDSAQEAAPLSICSAGCILHICIPYAESFIYNVLLYQTQYRPSVTVIHTTVPIGTTAKLQLAVHSPVLGRHDDMKRSIQEYTKWIGGDTQLAMLVGDQLLQAGIKSRFAEKSEHTEALKLMCLAKYGMSIAFAKYQKQVCDELGLPYDHILDWDHNYNEHVAEYLRRPIIEVDEKPIGGHCVVPGTEKLQAQFPNRILDEIMMHSQTQLKAKIWPPSNVYPSAKLGDNVSVGAFTEIGPNVVIGNNVRIGAHCFIPEGVTIQDDAWVGPRVTFTNDRFPPSGKDKWQKTLVGGGASIGAACTILPGVRIGIDSLVGAGSTVTKDIPAYEIWAGNPARVIPYKRQVGTIADERIDNKSNGRKLHRQEIQRQEKYSQIDMGF